VCAEICFCPLTASTTSEVKNVCAHIITQDICNKFIEIKFSVGCMVSQPNRLFHHRTPNDSNSSIYVIYVFCQKAVILYQTKKTKNVVEKVVDYYQDFLFLYHKEYWIIWLRMLVRNPLWNRINLLTILWKGCLINVKVNISDFIPPSSIAKSVNNFSCILSTETILFLSILNLPKERMASHLKSDNLQYNTLGRWDERLIDHASDVPSIIFFS
jgi:hypothetical protein